MMRLPPSEIELTQVDVTRALREMAVRRRVVQVAKKAAALALQDISGNARNTALDLDFHKLPISPLPLRLAEPEREESIIAKGPVPRGKKEFWDNVVAEAKTIYDAVSDSEDWPLCSPGHVHGDTVMTEDSLDGLFDITGESESLRVDCDMTDKNQGIDRERIGGDIDLRLNNGTELHARGRHLDGLDGAGEGSSFSSQSVSNSSLPWRQKDSEDSDGFSSQLQEKVVLGHHHSPDHSQFGQLEGSQSNNTVTKGEARISTLSHRFSTLLNLNETAEDSSSSSTHSPPAFGSSHSDHIFPVLTPSGHRTPIDRSKLPSPKRTRCRSSSSRDTKMGLKMWRDADYEQSVTLPTDVQTGSQTDQTCSNAGASSGSSSGGGPSTTQTEATSSALGIRVIDLRAPPYASAFFPASLYRLAGIPPPADPIDWTGLSPASPPPEPDSPHPQYSEVLDSSVPQARGSSGAANSAAQLSDISGVTSTAGSSAGH